MTDTADEKYRVNEETLVGEALFAVPGAAEIFTNHGCEVEWECTEEHHAEYSLLDTAVTCHIPDTDALIADLNAALDADEEARSPAAAA